MGEPDIPSYRALLYPTLEALDRLGGSGTLHEIDSAVTAALGLTDEQLAVEYPPDGSASGSKVTHRLAFARSSLKTPGALTNSVRGVWVITDLGRRILAEGDAAARAADSDARRRRRQERLAEPTDDDEQGDEQVEVEGADVTTEWRESLLDCLRSLSPAHFERLAARLLREAGFTQVEVLGRPDDQGIDGTGLLEIQLVSFPVFFQCKRYTNTNQVGPEALRDFRGAMAGRGDKGLFITTSTFTPGARKEASRAGVPPVDLIDGDRLCDLLKRFGLGVETEQVERVTIDTEYFDSI